jgi:hypothetical protein
MARLSRHNQYWGTLLVLAAAAISLAGCQGALLTAAYLIKGTDLEAEYDGLWQKKVVVVCRPAVDLTYRDANVAKDLARQISNLLRTNGKKIEVVDHRKVEEWTDENIWEEYVEIGQAFEADMVVGVELHDFTIYQGQTLYQGKANVQVRVFDCANGDEPVFERELPEILYPPNSPIPTTDKAEAEFRRTFVRMMAEQIGRYFYPHDAYADYALDATALD